MLFVLSAPSGAGKTTIAREALKRIPNARFSISATTRAPRPNERDGHDYFFVNRERFEEMVHAGEMLEWEEVYGNLYGTPLSEVQSAMEGPHTVLDIDVKGALSVKRIFGDKAVIIFIKPPSIEALRQRLLHRGEKEGETLRRRLERATWELGQEGQFDAVVLNDRLDKAIEEVCAFIETKMAENR